MKKRGDHAEMVCIRAAWIGAGTAEACSGGSTRSAWPARCVQVGTRTATNALPRRVGGLGIEMAKVAVGRSAIAPDPKDWRFENRAWKENPLFHRLGQAYLAWSRMALDLVDDAQFDWRTAERAKLATILLTAALAPTNAPLLNPDAVERAFETGGRSVVKGLGNISRDVRSNRGFPRSVDRGAFVVGRDLASPPVPSSSATRSASSCSTPR